jgi:hypothetical protein
VLLIWIIKGQWRVAVKTGTNFCTAEEMRNDRLGSQEVCCSVKLSGYDGRCKMYSTAAERTEFTWSFYTHFTTNICHLVKRTHFPLLKLTSIWSLPYQRIPVLIF